MADSGWYYYGVWDTVSTPISHLNTVDKKHYFVYFWAWMTDSREVVKVSVLGNVLSIPIPRAFLYPFNCRKVFNSITQIILSKLPLPWHLQGHTVLAFYPLAVFFFSCAWNPQSNLNIDSFTKGFF